MRLPRLGLRAQIVLSLSSVFALSFWLAGYATLQLTRRSALLDEARAAHIVARTLATALEQPGDRTDPALSSLCLGLGSRMQLVALRVERPGGSVFSCGRALGVPSARTGLAGGGHLVLWLSPAHRHDSGPVSALLIFYLALTGLAVLLLAYVALTYLIVRPLDRLTYSAEALQAGGEHVLVTERGSAEAARLARAFNEMAIMLRAERTRLVDRLAELERTTEELKSKEQQLIHGEKLASIGRLAAGVAHEIGNPLAAVLGLVELLREGGLSESETSEFLVRIQRETERINRIIRDLLDFARHDVDNDAPLQTADLHDVIADAVNLVRPQKESRAVAIDVAIDPATRRVQGPQHRLTQVVLNLVLNALDALDGKGRIAIRVEPAPDEKYLRLVVEDDGPGIAADMLDKLFDPFTTSKPAGEGTGLGLAVSHAIIDGLGGTIVAVNRPEGGARFEVRLRKAAAPAAALAV